MFVFCEDDKENKSKRRKFETVRNKYSQEDSSQKYFGIMKWPTGGTSLLQLILEVRTRLNKSSTS